MSAADERRPLSKPVKSFVRRLPGVREVMTRLEAVEAGMVLERRRAEDVQRSLGAFDERLQMIESDIAALRAGLDRVERLAETLGHELARSRAEAVDGGEPPVSVYGPRVPWEIPVQLCLRDFLHPGAVAFDVGANIGGVTVALSRAVGPEGHVHAFEANPLVLGRLRRDLEANGAGNVTIVPRAVWHRSGELLTLYSEQSPFQAGSGLFHHDESSVETIVESVALDDYCREHGVTPAAVKIDVEGAEYQVLRGAQALLRGASPVVVFEYRASMPPEEDPSEVLRACGYTLFDVNLYQEVDRRFYLSHFPIPPLVNVLAVPARLRSGWAVSIEPVGTMPLTEDGRRTEPVELPQAGRYMVSVELAGPETAVAGLRVRTTAGERLAFFEASLPHLRQHSCSNLLFEVDGSAAVVAEVVGDAPGAAEVTLTAAKAKRIVRSV